MPQMNLTPPATIYAWEGRRYYVCGTYKSMCYDDETKLRKSLKERFPGAEIRSDGRQINPIDFSPEKLRAGA